MAPVFKITALSLRKPLLSQIWARHHPLPLSLPILRRSVHASVYDKNLDEKIRTSFVQEEVVKPLSDKCWAPHPQTGVFGPQSDQAAVGSHYTTAEAGGSSKSWVMEQKAWFRHSSLEDLEKPHPHLP